MFNGRGSREWGDGGSRPQRKKVVIKFNAKGVN